MEEQREQYKERYPKEFRDRIDNIFEYSSGDPEYEEAAEWLQEYRKKHFNL